MVTDASPAAAPRYSKARSLFDCLSSGTCWPLSGAARDASNPGPGRVEGATRGVSSPLTASSTCVAAAQPPSPPDPLGLMESRGEKSEEADGVRVTPQLLKERSGEFSLESILLLKLRGLGLVDLGCLGDCLGLEWLDLSGNALTQLGPLASLR